MAEAAELEGPSSTSTTREATRVARRAAYVEVGAYVTTTLVRLASNLVLTRLLFPAAFGLMAMAQSITFVLWMLADVGITQAVVMSRRGDDPKFLDTAWTLQVIRGGCLSLACLALAWPAAFLLNEPRMLWLLPAASLGAAIHGFSSSRVFVARRTAKLLPLHGMYVCAHIANVIASITFAYFGFGVLALIIGGLVANTWEMVHSHLLPGTHRPRFRIEKESRTEIIRFGRWVFLSSSLTAFSMRADQLLLGRFIGASNLGFYQTALSLSEMPETVASRVVTGAMYPALSKVHNEKPSSFAATYYHMRVWLDPLVHVAFGGLIGISDWVIALLYDDRYAPAAPLLRILAFRAALQFTATLCENGFISRGESQFGFRRNLAVTAMLFVAMPVGNWMAGMTGVLWGSVIARAMALVALWPAARKRKFLWIGRELLMFPYLGAGYLLGKGLDLILPRF